MSATPSPQATSSSPRPGSERRRHERYRVQSRLTLRWLECGECYEELIRTEDVSRGGARLVVRMPLAEGEIVYVEARDPAFQTRAEVRRVYIGRDGEPRLGIAFMDAEAPERLFERRPLDSDWTREARIPEPRTRVAGFEIQAPVTPRDGNGTKRQS